MRVITGIYKGKKLISPEDTAAIRPTLDRVKEAIFDVIQFKIAGARVLDLFSGSGAMGIEAVSRGAAEVLFNDISPEAVALIRNNCKAVGFTPTIYSSDYIAFVQSLSEREQFFDIIILDPPYAGDMGINAVKAILQHVILAKNGVIVYEHSGVNEFEYPSGVTVKTKKYGKVKVDFIYKEE